MDNDHFGEGTAQEAALDREGATRCQAATRSIRTKPLPVPPLLRRIPRVEEAQVKIPIASRALPSRTRWEALERGLARQQEAGSRQGRVVSVIAVTSAASIPLIKRALSTGRGASRCGEMILRDRPHDIDAAGERKPPPTGCAESTPLRCHRQNRALQGYPRGRSSHMYASNHGAG